MKNLGAAILQAAALLAIAFAVGFSFNAISKNGLRSFARPVAASAPDSAGAIEGRIRVIALDEARGFVESGGPVIDARTRGQYEEGHIRGAILLDYYELGRALDEVLPLLSKEAETMVYCEGPSCDASELLAGELAGIGFTKLLVFKGGIEEWTAAGLPVEKGAP